MEVLRLEKRLDDELYYLRDCPQEYSTFPTDMEPEFLPEGEPVPINELVVPVGPKPWHKRWDRYMDRQVDGNLGSLLKRIYLIVHEVIVMNYMGHLMILMSLDKIELHIL